VSLLYAAIYLHYGVYGVFIPLWFQHKGMSPAQIGTLLALPVLLRVLFVAPVTALADRLRRIRDVLFACIALTAALVFVLNGISGYVALLFFFTLFAVAWDPLPILADAYATAAVRTRNLDFGRMRLWGTISLVTASMVGGRLLDSVGVDRVPVMTGLLLLTPLVVIPFLPPDRLFGESERAAAGEWKAIIRDRPAMFVLVGIALLTGSNGMLLGFGSIQFAAKGISNGNIGVLYAVAAVSEVLVFIIAQKLLGTRSELWMLVIGAAVTIVRWLGMATDPDLKVLVVLSLLQGPAGTTVIAGTILYIARRFPTHLVATANGVNAVLVGVAASLVTFAGGYLWGSMKALAYVPMAGLSAVALVIFVVATRRQGGPAVPRMQHASAQQDATDHAA
jgi:PPP family 3-phenylpropionic acid transporter